MNLESKSKDLVRENLAQHLIWCCVRCFVFFVVHSPPENLKFEFNKEKKSIEKLDTTTTNIKNCDHHFGLGSYQKKKFFFFKTTTRRWIWIITRDSSAKKNIDQKRDSIFMKKDKRYLSVRVRYVVTSIDSRPKLTSKQETSFLGTVHHIPQETQLQILRMDL